MPEGNRKRVFRRSLHRGSIWGDSQAVLQKFVQEANGYLLKIAELEGEQQPHSCDVKDGSAAVPKATAFTDYDVKASLQRLDEATAFLRQIAGLEEPHSCDVEEASKDVPEARVVTSDDVNANLQRLDEATAFLRQIAGLDEQTGQEVENTERKEDVGTVLYGVGDSAALAGDDDKLWDEFVMERSAKKGGKEIVKEKKTKSWLGKAVSRLFRRK